MQTLSAILVTTVNSMVPVRRAAALPMVWLLLMVVVASLSAAQFAAAAVVPVAEVIAQVDSGNFILAEKQIGEALGEPSLPAEDRKALEFERERMRRIRLDFPLTQDEVKARLRKSIPDLRAEEFEAWDKANLLEHLVIDGQSWYFQRSVSNLFLISKAAADRRQPPATRTLGPLETPHPHHDEVRRQALTEGRGNGLAPRRVRITYSLKVDADAVPAGESVRAWLPFPRALPGQQEDIRLVESTPSRHLVAPESTLQSTVYLEQPAQPGKKTEFSITYELTTFAQYHVIDPEKVVPAQVTPELAPFTVERAPHIVFTEDIRKFSKDVVGDETNPYRIAQKLFAAVDKTPWAGAREYSTLSNISDYALHAGHADCGQQSLLLMTLLRLNGIPTRWQSGWTFSDGSYDNMHDWGWLYLAPYGWVPMDVTYGRFATGDDGIDGFYLGGLDAYRVAFNDDYSQELVPAKHSFRSETVDSQRGEVEWSGGNLYFDKWDYSFDWKILSGATPAEQTGSNIKH